MALGILGFERVIQTNAQYMRHKNRVFGSRGAPCESSTAEECVKGCGKYKTRHHSL